MLLKRKKSKNNAKECHQTTRGENKRRRKEKNYANN